MPELPEVESARGLLERNAKGKTIKNVITIEQGGGPRDGLFDEIVCVKAPVVVKDKEVMTQDDFRSYLIGRKLIAVHRKGKQMWIELR